MPPAPIGARISYGPSLSPEESGTLGNQFSLLDLKGPLPVDEALGIARQIAAGLEAAHEKGITHRDLKPANIKLTPNGVVKILDFGLANSAATPGSNPTISPTLSMHMTQAGMILGTAAYMSPEQAHVIR
jgi:serine/threonine-protein kinase